MCVRELILRIFDAKVELLSIFRVLSIAQAIILCITIPALICALLISNKAYTQETNNTEIRDYLDRMFEKTQLKRVPTGFLLDYSEIFNFLY